MPDWKDAICGLPLVFRTGEKSIRQLFEPALGHLDDRVTFLAGITRKLREQPDLIDAWERYCADKRTGRGPFLELKPLVVGFYDSSTRATTENNGHLHTDAAEACADFIYREAAWVLRGVQGG